MLLKDAVIGGFIIKKTYELAYVFFFINQVWGDISLIMTIAMAIFYDREKSL
ncbi:hypothetical protein [Evansella clarkii]|uniref:hypothetical protein n=1 Tax=Evansella clarkii TaxID=79879 RepID=UPI00147656B3|nr:hypothetical protein [Evansella clarkii]